MNIIKVEFLWILISLKEKKLPCKQQLSSMKEGVKLLTSTGKYILSMQALLEYCCIKIGRSHFKYVQGQSNETKCNEQGKIVDCSHLNLTIIPRHIPIYATSLDLSKNSIKIVMGFTFQYFENLTALNLGYNLIQLIEKNAFHGLHLLQRLHLEQNSLQVLPIGMFNKLNCLKDLSIEHNKLQSRQDDQMKETSKILSLRTLSFDIDPDFKFPSEWSTLRHLTNLNIYARSTKVQFNKEMFVHIGTMQIKSLHLNLVPSISDDFFEHFSKLDSITVWVGDDLPKNPINQVFRSFEVVKSRNMTNIEIAYSRIDYSFILDYDKMKYLWAICLKRLTLHDLYIKFISLKAFQRFSVESKCLEYLEITMLDQEINILYLIQNFENLEVLKVLGNNHYIRSVHSKPSHLDTFIFILPNTLKELYIENNIAGDLNNVIFNNSLNLRVLSLKDNVIWSCEGSFAGVINVEYFDMSGWTCKNLSINLLYGFPNLQTLQASRSFLGHGFVNNAEAGSFLRKTLRLQDINLSSNKISAIPKGLFLHPFKQLLTLNMSRNNLIAFPKFHASIKALQIIDLTFNRITDFKDEDIDQIEKLGEVDILLRGNPLKCSCKTLQFMKWLGHSNRVPDILNLTCVTEKASHRIMSEVISNLKTFEISCKAKFWLTFAVAITCSIAIFVIVYFVIVVRYKRYKHAIESFLLRWKMKKKKYKELKEVHKYDAFISFSHTDAEWVKQFDDKLSSMGFSLCIDSKDFFVGNRIEGNVINVIDSSRKIIFIITHNFIKSFWESYEMEMTRLDAYLKGREDMVIIVLKDKIEINNMPETIQNIWSTIIRIQWPNGDNLPYNTQEIFYEKMKIYLNL